MRYNGDMNNNDSKKIKAVAYARCSTLLQQNPESQLIAIREFARNRSFDLVQEYVDHGISGAREKRPALDRMMKDAQAGGGFSAVICTGLDRISRNTKHCLTLIDDLHHFGVGLISLRESFDMTSPSGRLIVSVLSSVAEIERSLISERIRSSLAAKKMASQMGKGNWKCGRPLLATPEMIQKVLDLRSKGLSIREIEKSLGKAVSHATVFRILKSHRS
jgi:DNA invertase Pin-like site-specific DNA recombinase